MLALGLEDRIVAAAVLDHDVKDEYKEAFSKVNYLEEFTVNEVSSKVSNEEKQSAMVIEFYDDEIYTYGSKTLAGDMVTKLGAEDLIKLNPDCIFVSYMDMGDENIPVE